MKISDMFAIEIIIKNSLYAIKYADNYDEFENNEFFDTGSKNEFSRLFNNWQDPEYLDAFFNKYKKDLQKEFYNFISIEDAIQKTIDEAFKFEQKILSLAKKRKKRYYKKFANIICTTR